MRKVFNVILHILGFPVVIALVVLLNLNIITTQMKNYTFFVFIGVIVTVVMAIIYYICYACITKKPKQKEGKKKKKRKSIFNQTMRLCMVVVFTLTGLWVVCDVALPDFLADATSSTIYYEDLADGWNDRAEVNEDLLNTFIELNVKAGTLPRPNNAEGKKMKEKEAVDYYIGQGINAVIPALEGNEYYNTIGGLFAIQYQSINANGYQTFTHPWIDFATSDRLTIPCLIHLLLDKREIKQDAITLDKFTKVEENEEGKTEVTSVMFVVYDKEKKEITVEHVNWTVLDMLGTDNVIDLGGLDLSAFAVLQPLVTDILGRVARIVADEDILGSGLTVKFDMKEGKVVLTPSNAERGVLGYQEMAWLDSNGLIYALVTLFSLRRVFLVAAVYLVVINLLIGCARGMLKEEKERKKRAEMPLVKKAPEKKNDYSPYFYGRVNG